MIMTIAFSQADGDTTTVTKARNPSDLWLERVVIDVILDGSYFYRNGDNSSYYNDGNGRATYTAPGGKVYKK